VVWRNTEVVCLSEDSHPSKYEPRRISHPSGELLEDVVLTRGADNSVDSVLLEAARNDRPRDVVT